MSTRTELTYLVGTREHFERYLREHRYPAEGHPFIRVSELSQIDGVRGGRVIFLKDFQVLREWRAIYNFVLGHRITAIRNQDEYLAAEYSAKHWGTRGTHGGTR